MALEPIFVEGEPLWIDRTGLGPAWAEGECEPDCCGCPEDEDCDTPADPVPVEFDDASTLSMDYGGRSDPVFGCCHEWFDTVGATNWRLRVCYLNGVTTMDLEITNPGTPCGFRQSFSDPGGALLCNPAGELPFVGSPSCGDFVIVG